jgi:predicted nucleic acid-binding protein
MRILFDTNVLLDALLERQPYVQETAQLLAAVETGLLAGVLSATTATTIYYLVERARDRAHALLGLRRLLRLLEAVPVTRAVLEEALDLGFDDYEDAVQHEAARHAGAEGIVTRNVQDFTQAVLPIYTPTELLQVLRLR